MSNIFENVGVVETKKYRFFQIKILLTFLSWCSLQLQLYGLTCKSTITGKRVVVTVVNKVTDASYILKSLCCSSKLHAELQSVLQL